MINNSIFEHWREKKQEIEKAVKLIKEFGNIYGYEIRTETDVKNNVWRDKFVHYIMRKSPHLYKQACKEIEIELNKNKQDETKS
jgi:hypothetical protein